MSSTPYSPLIGFYVSDKIFNQTSKIQINQVEIIHHKFINFINIIKGKLFTSFN